MKPRIVKLRAGFLATTVPGSECLNRDGQPIGAEFDEYATMPTDAQREAPLAELFAHVPQKPLSEADECEIAVGAARSFWQGDEWIVYASEEA